MSSKDTTYNLASFIFRLGEHMIFFLFYNLETNNTILTLVVWVPSVDSKVVVTGDGGNSRGGDSRMGVGCHMGDRRVGQKLHYHTHIILDATEHHR